MCRALDVSAAGYYAWRSRPENTRSANTRTLLSAIRVIHQESRETYGSPRIWDALIKQGHCVGEHRVARLMPIEGIRAKTMKKWRAITQSNHRLPVTENTLNRQFAVAQPNRVWAGDITYCTDHGGAQILFDKFHILRHLADAMDQVRRAEYHRVAAKDRAFIKGQRYTLLSHRANLTLAGCRSLQKLLRANKRPATAYLLKKEFGQLWAYRREGWTRQFFTRWREQLKWQRLRPFERFAALIERHWDGIVAYCTPRNKVKLGFVEGLNNKIRMIQRRAYGYRDEEYMRLKILTAFLPKK